MSTELAGDRVDAHRRDRVTAGQQERRAVVVRALAELSPNLRLVVVSLYAGRDVAETAAWLGVSTGVVTRWANEAVRQLHQRLSYLDRDG
jgi:DNA-directed RNA polymerase specialized sigma24 family protein